MNGPLVSVVIPVYNCEKYIESSIKSLFSQSFKEFEIIVINDGSIDNTSNIVSNLVQEAPVWLWRRFLFINSQFNYGWFYTRL